MAYSLKIGKAQTTLTRSAKLIGLRSNDASAEQSIEGQKVFDEVGGFEVYSLDVEGDALDTKLDEIRQRDDIEVGTHVYYAAGSKKPIVPTGEIYIIFEEGSSMAEQHQVIQNFALQLLERRDDFTIIAKVTAQSSNPIKVAAQLQALALIDVAEPDIDAEPDAYDFSAPSDGLLSHQWHLENGGFIFDARWPTKRGADAKVVEAWRRLGNMGSDKITIAVIDNGFDLTHPDLKSNIVTPFDVKRQSSQLPQGHNQSTHGTACASIAISSSNDQGIVGVAPNARFMPIHGTSFNIRLTENMFEYCIENGADVISCSWGTVDAEFALNRPKEEAIAKAAREGRNGKGCVIVFAVGNEDFDYVNFYAAHPDVIAVAASNSKDEHAFYSNRGKEVSVCAPSNGDWPIIAARAWWDDGLDDEVGEFRFWRDGRNRGSRYKHFGGTSSSAPLVAGVCALILSANPDLTAAQVKDVLQKTADRIGSPSDYDSRGHSRKYGYGRVNAARAVAEALRLKDAAGGQSGVVIPPVVEEQVKRGRGLFGFNVRRLPSAGFGVQVGVFAEYGNVLVKAEELQRKFEAPVVVHIDELNGKTVYRVMLGQFSDKDDASRLLASMRSRGQDGYVRSMENLV